ncbi:MAG TPA: GNAT family N-acetyltransferase [Vicinamibacterales bacterium]|nr:GNAT family N-acetyltransferase [Vicinamibacterales bacterium]
MNSIRLCRVDEHPAILAIVNAAAERYRGVIPADCWHDPYMPFDQLENDIAGGVTFWGYDDGHDGLLGVMGIQAVREVELIRHAYIRPGEQGRGVGGTLLRYLENRSRRQILIGTWANAEWAIHFYQKHGYQLAPSTETARLLRTYWTITPRQAEASVVLSKSSAHTRALFGTR